jgi:hypothetical protein
MKLFSNEYFFSHPWSLVSAANWKKYPNDITPHVIHVDYLDRHVDPKTGILYTKRLLTCKQAMPAWITRLLGATSEAYVYEESEIDPHNKVVVMKARNLTLRHLMSVEETCTFVPSKTDPNNATVLKQEATISMTRAFSSWISNMVEEFSLERFHTNAVKGRTALEHTLERIREETAYMMDHILPCKSYENASENKA